MNVSLNPTNAAKMLIVCSCFSCLASGVVKQLGTIGPHYFALLAIFVPSWTVFRHHLPEIWRVDDRRDAFKRKVKPESELGQSIPWLE